MKTKRETITRDEAIRRCDAVIAAGDADRALWARCVSIALQVGRVKQADVRRALGNVKVVMA